MVGKMARDVAYETSDWTLFPAPIGPCNPRILPSPIEVAGQDDFTKFLDAHHYGLANIMSTIAYLVLGRTDTLPDAKLVVRCRAAPIQVPHPNPANNWVLRAWRPTSYTEEVRRDPSFARLWDQQAETMAMSEDGGRSAYGSRYAGIVTVIFHIEGYEMLVVTHVPVWILRETETGALQDAGYRCALEDVVRMCSIYINNGVHMWPLLHPMSRLALPAKLVKTGRRQWEHVAFENKWRTDLLDRYAGTFRTGCTPSQLTGMFACLNSELYVLRSYACVAPV